LPVFGVELDGEAARVAKVLGRVAAVYDRGEAQEDGRALALLLKQFRARVLRRGFAPDAPVSLEVSVRARAARTSTQAARSPNSLQTKTTLIETAPREDSPFAARRV
jgi:hypothetical protein